MLSSLEDMELPELKDGVGEDKPGESNRRREGGRTALLYAA